MVAQQKAAAPQEATITKPAKTRKRAKQQRRVKRDPKTRKEIVRTTDGPEAMERWLKGDAVLQVKV
jgi:hypothetical protein